MVYFLFILFLGVTTYGTYCSDSLIPQTADSFTESWLTEGFAPSLKYLEQNIKKVSANTALSTRLLQNAINNTSNRRVITLLLLHGADAGQLKKSDIKQLRQFVTPFEDGQYSRMLAQGDRDYRGKEKVVVEFEKPPQVTDLDLWALIYKSPEEVKLTLARFNFRQLVALSQRSTRYYTMVRDYIRSHQAPIKRNIIITSVGSHLDIAQYVQRNSVLIYDVDETLTYRRGVFFHREAAGYKKTIQQQIKELASNLYPKVASKIHKEAKLFLMEKEIPELISSFISQEIPVLACTKRYHGKFGIIGKFEEHTHQLLQALGITFNFCGKNLKIELDPKECKGGRSSTGLLYNNIFFTDNNSKGPALIELFLATGFVPEHVVIIDDLEENLYEAEASLALWGIDVTCIRYIKTPPSEPFDHKELVNIIDEILHRTLRPEFYYQVDQNSLSSN
jgi:hypothetical protein